MTTSPLKVEDSRADFEAWFNDEMMMPISTAKPVIVRLMFKAWQASRAAIIVELDKCNCDNGEESVWDDAIEYCEVTLRAAGITVKGDS